MKSVYILAIALLPGLNAFSQQDQKVKALILSEVRIGEPAPSGKTKGADKKNVKKVKKQVAVQPATQNTNSETVTLVDEKQYKAKSRFELVLQRRLEIDADEAKERGNAGNKTRRN